MPFSAQIESAATIAAQGRADYAKTYDPRNISNPYVPFDLWSKQEELCWWIMERVQTQTPGVIEKSRDTGVSWTFCGMMLWLWQFVDGFAGGLGSRKLEYVDSKGDPKTLFEKMGVTEALRKKKKEGKFDKLKEEFMRMEASRTPMNA